ncbi:MAG: group II intron maturase-specific domain-containing protein, partial [Solirubrobacteraceae bacterium]
MTPAPTTRPRLSPQSPSRSALTPSRRQPRHALRPTIRQHQHQQQPDARWGHSKPSRRGQCKPSFLPFERYADDGVVHCQSRRQAELVPAGIAARMNEVGLRLHPQKTRIVYCRDSNRREPSQHTTFTFLGFAFRPRKARNRNGEYFTAFLPAISPEALKAKGARLRELRIHRRTDLTLDDLARWLNPIIAGWIRYYGRFYRSALNPLLK